MENPIKMDDLGVPLFPETSTFKGTGTAHGKVELLHEIVLTFSDRQNIKTSQTSVGDPSDYTGKS